jgi:L-threonylcarbamoyladenylate synthase
LVDVWVRYTTIQKDSDETRALAVRIILDGGVIAFRTDTFYGLGADPLNSAAVRKIKELKGREETKPILILVSDVDETDRFVENPEGYKAIAVRYWPAPLTLVGAAKPELPIELTAGTSSIGIRLPDDENVRSLVRACGGALTATSANLSGRSPARTADEVEQYFSSGIDLVIDAGQVEVTKPSTVVDLTGEAPRIIREGAFSLESGVLRQNKSTDYADLD